MKLILITIALLFTYLTLGNPPPSGSVFIDGGDSTSALILAHGKGKHPKWLVVNPLRKGINQKLAYHTLSLQMPIGNGNWKDYVNDFPKAHEIIDEAVIFLESRGVRRIILMGSRMVSSYIYLNPSSKISALIVAGCRNNGRSPLSCKENLEGINIPVLDIWSSNNYKDLNAASERSSFKSVAYTQVEIAGANHKFAGYENEFVLYVADWLKGLE